MLTKRQKQILNFIGSFQKRNGYSPTLEEIKVHLHLNSVSTAHFHVSKLQNLGYLFKDNNKPRSINSLKEMDILKVPLIGIIAAGQPIEAVETPDESITITNERLGPSENLYALQVRGSSMIDEGIFDGDIVVIRQQKNADNGQTVVAIIDENEATLKKFYRESNKIRLQPANPTLFPIFRDQVEIRGIVVKIIRNLNNQTNNVINGSKYNRRIDYSWDYRKEPTKSFTHCLHTYPAMFIPQVARRLIETYSQKGETVCDIFCGSGTTLVESRILGRNSYGIDLNPLAIFLAKVKTKEINPTLLNNEYFKLYGRIRKIKDTEVKIPKFFNIDFWFKEDVIVQLAKIKKAIKEISNQDVSNFFLVALSETARLSSNSKNGEFKLVRINKDKLAKYSPNVFEIFKKRTEINIKGAIDFFNAVDKNTWTKIILGDSSVNNGIPQKSIDCIITSPPYGDSRTTVAYGQFSRLSSQWIDIFDDPNDASSVDNKLLGGHPTKTMDHILKSQSLTEILKQIEEKDKKRAQDVLSFFIGINKCMEQAYKMLKPYKHFCIVIGNRLVKQVRIPTDFIIADLGENIGFSCEDIIVRNIPDKRMPIRNSPTNIVGALEETMNKESIVILRKN